MTKAKIIGFSLAGVAVAAVIGTTLFLWLSDREVRRVMAMQEKLLTADLSSTDSNSLKTQLMRSIDEMDRDTLRELQRKMRDQQRERTRASVAAYHDAVGDEQVAVLDEALERLARAREVGLEAFGTRRRGMPRGARQGNQQQPNRGDRQRRNRDDNAPPNAARRDRTAPSSDATGQPREGQPRRDGDQQRRQRQGRDDRGGDRERQQLSDAEREKWDEYRQALRKRAEERGMDWGRRRRG